MGGTNVDFTCTFRGDDVEVILHFNFYWQCNTLKQIAEDDWW